jgi:predicted membrane protein
MDNNLNNKKRYQTRIFAGLILVAVGAAFLMRNAGFPLPYWLFSWPVLLILIGVYSGFKHNFSNNIWIVLIVVGAYFFIDKFIFNISLAPYFWPIAIIALGVYFIVRPEGRKRLGFNNTDKFDEPGNMSNANWEQPASNNNFSTDKNNFLKVESVFSGVKRTIISKNFQGGKIECVFGGADVDLTQAEIQGRVEVRFDVVFGGAKLIVPPHWTVINEIDGVFHGVDDKRKYNTSTDINQGKELVLRGSVVFGGIEIRSF